jgi:hypothetical protein
MSSLEASQHLYIPSLWTKISALLSDKRLGQQHSHHCSTATIDSSAQYHGNTSHKIFWRLSRREGVEGDFVLYIAYTMVSQAESMGKKAQNAFREKKYLGDGSQDVPFFQQAVEGLIGIFAAFYDSKVPMARGASSSNQSNAVQLVLKPELHCDSNKHIVVSGWANGQPAFNAAVELFGRGGT